MVSWLDAASLSTIDRLESALAGKMVPPLFSNQIAFFPSCMAVLARKTSAINATAYQLIVLDFSSMHSGSGGTVHIGFNTDAKVP